MIVLRAAISIPAHGVHKCGSFERTHPLTRLSSSTLGMLVPMVTPSVRHQLSRLVVIMSCRSIRVPFLFGMGPEAVPFFLPATFSPTRLPYGVRCYLHVQGDILVRCLTQSGLLVHISYKCSDVAT